MSALFDPVRYGRHTVIPEIGPAGQQRLLESSVLLIGAGGLGSPAALYLAAAGVGRIGIIDPDVVDLSNLQRQVLYTTEDIGSDKASVAADRLRVLNPDIEVKGYTESFTGDNAEELFGRYDIVLDGADNFGTRYLASDASVVTGTPVVHGSVYRFDGQVTLLDPGAGGPCYRCLYPEPPEPGTVPNCAEAGVLGVLPGVVGSLQATEAIKRLLQLGEPLIGRLFLLNLLDFTHRIVKFAKNPDCPACGEHADRPDLSGFDYDTYCSTTSDNEPESMSLPAITVEELKRMRDDNVPHTLIDVRQPNEYEFANIGGTLIPLGEIPSRIQEIPEEGDVILMCRSGGRSSQAVAHLMAAGRKNVKNLTGGIRAWSDKIDSNIPKY